MTAGPNPLFGGLKSTKSMFGRSNHVWVEGEGMLHALYFKKETDGSWNVVYMNRHVESETFKQEKQRNRPSFLPAIEGDSLAILSAYLLNLVGIPKSASSSPKCFLKPKNKIKDVAIILIKNIKNYKGYELVTLENSDMGYLRFKGGKFCSN